MLIEFGLHPLLTGIIRAVSGVPKPVPFIGEDRYFRINEGTTDYISHSSVTVDRIVMDVYPTAGNVGLPTGAPAVTNDLLQTIDFVYSGTIDELCRNGASYFAGIVANVKYYLADTLVRSYVINDHSGTLIDTVSGQNGAVMNGDSDDWGLFQEQPTLWKGQSLTVPPWDSVDQELLKA